MRAAPTQPSFSFSIFCNLFLLSCTPEGLVVFLFTGGAANSSSWFSLSLPLWYFINSSHQKGFPYLELWGLCLYS